VKHPNRYPIHEGDKGQIYGGECNTTRCSNGDAVFWNMGTYGLYCPVCAAGINWQRNRPPLCVQLGEKPETIEAMEKLKEDHNYYGAIA